MMIKKLLIETDDSDDFIVEIEIKNGDIYGSIYPIYNPEDGENYEYFSNNGNGETVKYLNDECRKLFSFYYEWRGLFDGRIYFTDQEYFDSDLKEMSEIWDIVEPLMKDEIRQIKPYAKD